MLFRSVSPSLSPFDLSSPPSQPDSLALKHISNVTNDVYGFEMSPTGGTLGRAAESGGDGVAMSGRKHGKDSDSDTEGLPAKMRKSEEVSVSREGATPAISAPATDAPGMDESNETMPEGETPVITSKMSCQTVVMEWHACSICLEEMVDSDLLTHKDCGAIVCPTCLKSSVEHYGKEEGLVPCPVRRERVEREREGGRGREREREEEGDVD